MTADKRTPAETNLLTEHDIRLRFHQHISTVKAMRRAINTQRITMTEMDVMDAESEIACIQRIADYCSRALSSLPKDEIERAAALNEHSYFIEILSAQCA